MLNIIILLTLLNCAIFCIDMGLLSIIRCIADSDKSNIELKALIPVYNLVLFVLYICTILIETRILFRASYGDNFLACYKKFNGSCFLYMPNLGLRFYIMNSKAMENYLKSDTFSMTHFNSDIKRLVSDLKQQSSNSNIVLMWDTRLDKFTVLEEQEDRSLI